MQEIGACECQLKHWKTRQKKNKNIVSGNIHAVSFVAGPELFIASLRFAVFVLELWLTKERYRVLKKPVGKESSLTIQIWL
jgi:hypothetical protein